MTEAREDTPIAKIQREIAHASCMLIIGKIRDAGGDPADSMAALIMVCAGVLLAFVRDNKEEEACERLGALVHETLLGYKLAVSGHVGSA